MAAQDSSGSYSISDPLIDDVVDGVVDYRGRRVRRSSKCGRWRSASFIIGVEIAERFAYYGISSNLITYLTGPLGQSTASAAENVNAWSGAASMLPLIGAFVADSYLGRYRTILISSVLYVVGLGLLTLSAVIQPQDSSSSSMGRVIFFFSSLYLVAIAQGGHKPCVQAFGADQFDGTHPEESKSRSSFFNWWYFSLCLGTAFTISILNYIQDNLNWGLGFGIPCAVMAVAFVVFLLGTKTYRYSFEENKSNPFVRVAQVYVAAARNWRATPPSVTVSKKASFLDKALAGGADGINGSRKGWKTCSITQVEEAKALLRLVPIWVTCVIYAVVFAQSSTFFTKQGSTIDRSIGPNFQIPPATLQTFISLSIVIFLPIYDRVFIPIARKITGEPSGITMLQRIGFGMLLSLISMVVAALVEIKRLQIVKDFGLADKPSVTVPMSMWWLAPQYILFGIADVFTMVGLQEFFYDQVPDALRSLGLALYLSIFGVGSFLSSFIISIIEKATGGGGRDSWFSNNLNRAHLDYFYWLLAILSTIELAAYLYFAGSYTYNREVEHADEDVS
ncbi:hypothetical protein Scep_002982 [Stephania cephalantha]|uniref:Peptide transporter n=1 Tax=Stephania cephalantha TaxID=152367 RepID=A0AAP0LB84_9MAGN